MSNCPPNNNKHVHKWRQAYINKIDVCLQSSTKSFEELKKIRSGRIINGSGSWGILGRSLSWFRKLDSGSKIQRVANCLKIYNNKETATFTKNELFIDVASSPHIPHLKRWEWMLWKVPITIQYIRCTICTAHLDCHVTKRLIGSRPVHLSYQPLAV